MRLLALTFPILLISCSPNRSINSLSADEQVQLNNFKDLAPRHQLQISEDDEPGEKLWLCLTFVEKTQQEPIRDRPIKLYHTSAAGEYEPADPGDESTARLNGAAITDEQGRIFVRTILPGDYGSSTDNRHIHTTVENARPEAYDIHFRQYTSGMGKNFVEGSDQHFLADLKYAADSILVTFVTIEVKE